MSWSARLSALGWRSAATLYLPKIRGFSVSARICVGGEFVCRYSERGPRTTLAALKCKTGSPTRRTSPHAAPHTPFSFRKFFSSPLDGAFAPLAQAHGALRRGQRARRRHRRPEGTPG